MTIALAVTWNPRGELPRFERLLSLLLQYYSGIAISFPPHADPQVVDAFTSGVYAGRLEIRSIVNQEWSHGRYQALHIALGFPVDYFHYADMDRLLRWVETMPDEWRAALLSMKTCDCLVMGRSPAAYATHPQALRQTEAISNQVVSYLLGRQMDISAGSKGLSRWAVEYLVRNTQPGHALGTDAEWPLLLQRAGFRLDYLQVDGLEWESADRGQLQAANSAQQKAAAESYDTDPQHWAWRVEVAREIVEMGLQSNQRLLPAAASPWIATQDSGSNFDFDAVFEVDDYMYFYADMLTAEGADRQVQALVQWLDLDRPLQILDLACGFGRHANRLAALGHQITGIDLIPGFLDLARQDAARRGVVVNYLQGDMRFLDQHKSYDRILLIFTAFGYFEDLENLQVLRNVARALKPGGLFIMDTHNRDVFLRNFQPHHITEKEGNLMLDRNSFDSQTGRLYNRRIVFRNGLRRDKPFFVRLYNPSEILALYQQAGLTVKRFYADWDGNPLTSDSRKMIVIAAREE